MAAPIVQFADLPGNYDPAILKLERWQRMVQDEEYFIQRMTDKLSRAKNLGKRHRFAIRIQRARARIVALTLGNA